MSEEQEKSLEEIFGELDGIIEKLEDRNVSLEKSFEIYSEGMKKIKICNDKIDRIEKKILVIDEDGSLNEF